MRRATVRDTVKPVGTAFHRKQSGKSRQRIGRQTIAKNDGAPRQVSAPKLQFVVASVNHQYNMGEYRFTPIPGGTPCCPGRFPAGFRLLQRETRERRLEPEGAPARPSRLPGAHGRTHASRSRTHRDGGFDLHPGDIADPLPGKASKSKNRELSSDSR
jgi:hypothetical protein